MMDSEEVKNGKLFDYVYARMLAWRGEDSNIQDEPSLHGAF